MKGRGGPSPSFKPRSVVLEALFPLLVYLDSNVLISACLVRGHKFLEFWRMHGVTVAVSMYAVNEVRSHLLAEIQHHRFDGLLATTRLINDADERILPASVDLPKKDRPILAAALAGEVDFLITGDKKHFGKYYDRRVSRVTIVSPGDFLARNNYRLML